MAREGFPGTQPSRMRPWDAQDWAGERTKTGRETLSRAEGFEGESWWGCGCREGGERRQSQAGQPWSLVSLVRASGLHPRARGDPGKQKSPRVRGGGGTGGLRIRRELVGPCMRGRALWGKGRG